MIELVRIPTENVNDAWGMVSQNIADALARSNGYARAEHIKEWILQNKMQLWILWDSQDKNCLLYTSPSPRDDELSRMPSSA